MSGHALGVEGILAAMPHRYPFVLLDRILEQSPGRCVALKNVTIGEAHFTGHFPGRPIMPGCLIMEALAQAGSFLGGSDDGPPRLPRPPRPPITEAFLLSSEVKFLKPVVPGDRLVITASFLSEARGIVRFKSEGHVDNALVASGRFTVLVRRGADADAPGEA